MHGVQGDICMWQSHLSSIQICIYGPHVFMGYLNNEDKTSEAIDDDEWLHSRDIGKLQVNVNSTSK